METATIISRYSSIRAERFFEDYVYQLLLIRSIGLEINFKYIPISHELNIELAFNRMSLREDQLATQRIEELHKTSENLIIGIDRGITDKMDERIRYTLRNKQNAKIIAFTVMPDSHPIKKIINAVNEDDFDTELERYESIRNILDMFKKKNQIIYRTSGDLTTYRQTIPSKIIDIEQNAMNTLTTALKNKVERDMVNSREFIERSPFVILENAKKDAEKNTSRFLS